MALCIAFGAVAGIKNGWGWWSVVPAGGGTILFIVMVFFWSDLCNEVEGCTVIETIAATTPPAQTQAPP